MLLNVHAIAIGYHRFQGRFNVSASWHQFHANICRGNRPAISRLLHVFIGIAKGMLYLHDHNIIHGDLKVNVGIKTINLQHFVVDHA